MPDVLIIGAGPAGGLAGYRLARAGQAVVMVDQAHFPRDKVCGECLSPLGIAVLQRAKLLDRLMEAGAVQLTQFCLHSPGGRSVAIPLPHPMLGISRLHMDHLIARAAQEAGATVRQRVRCEEISPGETMRVVLRNLENNTVEEVTAKHVLLADGRSAMLQPRPKPTDDFGIKAHFAGVDGSRGAVELFGVAGHYGGMAPVEQGLWNVAFSVPQRRLKECPDLDELFARIIEENEALRERMAKAWRVGEWLASPLPRFAVRSAWPAGVIPLGNAAAAIEPIGGEGMGLALRSAELAAEAVASGHADPAQLRRQFIRLWRRRRSACRLAGWIVSRPRLCSTATILLGSSQRLAQRVVRWTGKIDAATPAETP